MAVLGLIYGCIRAISGVGCRCIGAPKVWASGRLGLGFRVQQVQGFRVPDAVPVYGAKPEGLEGVHGTTRNGSVGFRGAVSKRHQDRVFIFIFTPSSGLGFRSSTG